MQLFKQITLAEVAILIGLISMIWTVGAIDYSTQISKTNDTIRLSDLMTLQSGIEQFYQDTAQYPNNANWQNSVYDFTGKDGKSGVLIYTLRLPKDPKNGQTCSNWAKKWSGTICTYLYNSGRDSYGIDGWEYKLSTWFEFPKNIEEKAAMDKWAKNEQNRYERGVNLQHKKSTQCTPKKVAQSPTGIGKARMICKWWAAMQGALFIAGNPKITQEAALFPISETYSYYPKDIVTNWTLSSEELAVIKKDLFIEDDSNAKFTVIEYSNLEDPYSILQYQNGVITQLKDKYKKDINHIFVPMSLSRKPDADKKGIALLCVGKIGGTDKYIQFYQAIMKRSDPKGTMYPLDKLPALAEEIMVDTNKFKTCYDNKETEVQYWTNTINMSSKIDGTPTSIIINNETKKFEFVQGAAPIANFEAAFTKLK